MRIFVFCRNLEKKQNFQSFGYPKGIYSPYRRAYTQLIIKTQKNINFIFLTFFNLCEEKKSCM